jgi:tetratricopeptide (TPR) repeat protein
LRISPDDPVVHNNLGVVLWQQGKKEKALRHFSAANRAAWALATNPDPALRNGAQALGLARQACQATGDERADFLDTLAAAYAELGRLDEAAATARRALTMAETQDRELARAIRERLRLYEMGRPFREGPGQGNPEAASNPPASR